MKYEIKMVTPTKMAYTAEKGMYAQLRIITSAKREYAPKEIDDWFVWKFDTNFKTFGRVGLLVHQTNNKYKQITKKRKFKFFTRKWSKEKLKDTIDKYYTDPMQITVTQEPTPEEISCMDDGLVTRMRKKFKSDLK